MKYYFFLGTMAELIKMMGVLKEFSDRGIPYKVVLSGQHDLRNSDLWDIVGKREFDFVLYDKPIKKFLGAFAYWWFRSTLEGFWVLRKEFKGDRSQLIWIISCDTASTAIGAFLGFVFGLRIAHVEAGLTSRRFFIPFPEEFLRKMSSWVSDLLFCPNQWCVENLKGYPGKKIDTQHNTIADSLKIALAIPPKNPLIEKLKGERFFVFSIHRQENIYNDRLFRSLIDEVLCASKGYRCVFVMYDLTVMKISDLGLMDALRANPNIVLIPRMPYLEYMHLLNACSFLITDGGSNQEDSYLLGKPCLILREVTERIEGLGDNVLISLNSPERISQFIQNYNNYERKPPVITVSPSKIVAETLLSPAQ